MRKTMTRLLTLLALLALVFAITACRGGNDNDNGNGGVVTPPTVDPGPVAPPDDGNDEPFVPPVPRGVLHPQIDMGMPDGSPRTISVGSWYVTLLGGSLRGAIGAPEMDPEHPMYFQHVIQAENRARVEELYNVRFETVVTADYSAHAELFPAGQIAGEPIADIIRINARMVIPGIGADNFVELTALAHPVPGYSFRTQEDPGSLFLMHANPIGDRSWVLQSDGANLSQGFMTVNMDLVRQLGLPNPVELYEAGQWNWDAWLDIMRMAKAQGYWGIAGQVSQTAMVVMGANESRYIDENFNFAMNHPNTIQAFDMMQTLMVEGLWRYNEELGIDGTPWEFARDAFRDMADSVFGIIFGIGAMHAELPFDFMLVPHPPGPGNTQGTLDHTGVLDGFGIPTGTDLPPEYLLILLEELHAWCVGYEWTVTEGRRDGLIANLRHERCVDLVMGYGGRGRVNQIAWSSFMREGAWIWYSDIQWRLTDGVVDPASIVEIIQGPVQEILDAQFGGLR